MATRPFLIYGGKPLSYFCETKQYIDGGFAGECWKKCIGPSGCCCDSGDKLVQDAVFANSADCITIPCGDVCPPEYEAFTGIQKNAYPGGDFVKVGGDWVQTVNSPEGDIEFAINQGSSNAVPNQQAYNFTTPHVTFLNAASESYSFTFSRDLLPCEELVFTIFDIDTDTQGEEITIIPTPDNQGTTGELVETVYGWDALPLSGAIEHTIYTPISKVSFAFKIVHTETLCCTRLFDHPSKAVWYDPSVSCSTEFLGLLVSDVTYGQAYERKVTETFTGGYAGAKQLKPRDILVEGFIVSSSDCGTQYGLDWLNRFLDAPNCGADVCNKPDLTVSLCCDNGGGKGVRTLKRVAVTSPVEEIESSFPRSCGVQVQFTMVAEVPQFFATETESQVLTVGEDLEPNWCCPTCNNIPDWGICPTTSEYTDVTAEFSGISDATCYCEPVFAFKGCEFVEGDKFFDTYLHYSIRADQDIRNISIYAYPDLGASPIDNPGLYACQAVGVSQIAYIPGGHTFSFDSGNLQQKMTGLVDEEVNLAGIGVTESMVLGCGGGWICLTVDGCVDADKLHVEYKTSVGYL